MILSTTSPVTLVGGAPVAPSVIFRAKSLAPKVVAADGGADSALAQGIIPEAVIGDFDSFSDEARTRIPGDRLHLIDEQDTTDFDKCLRNITAPLVIGVGFSGARQDHQLACYNTLVRHPWQRCILLSEAELVFLAPPALDLNLAAGCPVSLFPMGAVEGVSDGLGWPISGLNFAPDGRVWTSNRATGPVNLAVTAPKMLVILPASTIEQVAAVLIEAPARWPCGVAR